ncbi:hypothetical protein [Streptomyces sp. ME18-1-4]|uniref:hypothetical protein n=1 Tax=Streptomyces sp. ME18-1-4 TaxID=3028685 RepID=UPI0029B22D53|nr:hypothetical protein [Streptomyces sp. ME18-1-4]MDX3247170.1 hypothetical protein [Streptomyces sp. ME18-1-4]
MTAVQLSFTDCDPAWQPAAPKNNSGRRRRRPRLNLLDLYGQGLSNWQLAHMTTIDPPEKYL